MNFARLRSIFWKEFIQMRRDRGTLRLLLVVPVMQLLMFGFAIRQEVRNLPTVVFDLSRSQESRDLVQKFEATDNFLIRGNVNSYTQALNSINNGSARAAIVIPADYAKSLKRGRPVEIQVLVDATDPTGSQAAIGSAQLVGLSISSQLMRVRTGTSRTPAPIDVRVRPLYNPALESALFIVPGIIGMILSNILVLMTAMAVVREREVGTLEQLIVTPLKSSEIMLGKILPYALVGLVQISAVMVLGHLLFHVPLRGSILLVYAMALLFIIANLGLGLFISTLAKSQVQAMQTSFLFMLPNVLLSGFMFPREAMPDVARWIGYGLPLTYFLQVIRGILLKGNGLSELWPQALALLAFAVLYFTFSTLRFHKQLE